MTQNNNIAPTTSIISNVLVTWVENFLEDVPAKHENGKSYVEYEVLREHLRNLDYDAQAEILLKMEV